MLGNGFAILENASSRTLNYFFYSFVRRLMTAIAKAIFVVLVLGVLGCSPHDEFDRTLLRESLNKY